MVKNIISLICKPLSNIFNKCIVDGYFSKKLKIAQIVPVFKNGERSSPNNYRTISILTVFSKILEKHLYDQLIMHFDSHNIIANQQCGFRKEVSTNIAIGKFFKRVYSGINEGKYGIGLFLDLQKAFDVVNHKILLKKLYHYGVRGSPHRLIQSFLSDRQQYIKIDQSESSVLDTSIGTPQGSVLSPLLFIIFINDIVNSSDILHFNLFTDDTCIYLSDNNIEELYSIMNCEILIVQKWINANLLSLNVNKTVHLLFTGSKRVQDVPQLFIFNTPIDRKPVTKFLGMLIDDKLSWKPHAQNILGKISRICGVIGRVRSCMTTDALKAIGTKNYGSFFYVFIVNNIILVCMETWC